MPTDEQWSDLIDTALDDLGAPSCPAAIYQRVREVAAPGALSPNDHVDDKVRQILQRGCPRSEARSGPKMELRFRKFAREVWGLRQWPGGLGKY
jgi:hypothetical protein